MAEIMTLQELHQHCDKTVDGWLVNAEGNELNLTPYQKFLIHFSVTKGLTENTIYIPRISKMIYNLLDDKGKINRDGLDVIKSQLGAWGIDTNDMIERVIYQRNIIPRDTKAILDTWNKINKDKHHRSVIHSSLRVCVRDMDTPGGEWKGDGLKSIETSLKRFIEILVENPGVMVTRLLITYGSICKSRGIRPDDTINVFLYSIPATLFKL